METISYRMKVVNHSVPFSVAWWTDIFQYQLFPISLLFLLLEKKVEVNIKNSCQVPNKVPPEANFHNRILCAASLWRVATYPRKPGNPGKRWCFLEIDVKNLENDMVFKLSFLENQEKIFSCHFLVLYVPTPAY